MAWTRRTKIWRRFSYVRRVQPRKDELTTAIRIQLSLFFFFSLPVLVRFCSSDLFICVKFKWNSMSSLSLSLLFEHWVARLSLTVDMRMTNNWMAFDAMSTSIHVCVCLLGWQQATVARSPRTHVVRDGGRKTLTTSGNLPADEVWICFRSCWHNLARQSFALIRPNAIHDSTRA